MVEATVLPVLKEPREGPRGGLGGRRVPPGPGIKCPCVYVSFFFLVFTKKGGRIQDFVGRARARTTRGLMKMMIWWWWCEVFVRRRAGRGEVASALNLTTCCKQQQQQQQQQKRQQQQQQQ